MVDALVTDFFLYVTLCHTLAVTSRVSNRNKRCSWKRNWFCSLAITHISRQWSWTWSTRRTRSAAWAGRWPTSRTGELIKRRSDLHLFNYHLDTCSRNHLKPGDAPEEAEAGAGEQVEGTGGGARRPRRPGLSAEENVDIDEGLDGLAFISFWFHLKSADMSFIMGPGRHDICQNVYTSKLWTCHVLPEGACFT